MLTECTALCVCEGECSQNVQLCVSVKESAVSEGECLHNVQLCVSEGECSQNVQLCVSAKGSAHRMYSSVCL